MQNHALLKNLRESSGTTYSKVHTSPG